jgi:A/G-specific adenine glycosylase
MRNKKALLQSFPRKLALWYSRHHRKLPWRESNDPYKIWVSEVMLQQTTVRAVIPYYRKWLKLFPDVKSLSRAPLQKVLKAWQGLGYYQRAKNLHLTAQAICHRFGGQIPPDFGELRNLPGFGPYTAAAVASFAFDKPYPVVDANIRRVLMRLAGLRSEAGAKNDKALLRFLEPFLPSKKMGTFNQALMELGSQVCRPKNPLCLLCPVSKFCRAFKEGAQEIIPAPKKRNYRKVEAVVAIIQRKGKFLIQKRPPQGLLADLWEFPGGKRKKGETLEEALRREIKEELLADAKGMKFMTRVNHAYTQFQVSLSAYECKLNGRLRLSKDRHRWVSLKGLRHYPFPSGSAKIVEFLETAGCKPRRYEPVIKK